ncbi:arsenate reductase family protein [Ilumatobacter sp.]|uniref:arsenate reductase family protein n=1 Tax=Ilumatobacter sp. TaxID=1967498 RepID=UPI003AF41BC6
MRIAEELGVDFEAVVYRTTPPDEATLRDIIAKLEDPPTDLVRRDSLFKKLELSDDDVQSVDQVVDTILANKMIMQRPVVVAGDRAIIGRPKERVRELLSG